jgi:hypothetical protein
MKPRICLMIGMVFSLVGFAGCTHYVEQETPPGQLAAPIQPVEGRAYRNFDREDQSPAPAASEDTKPNKFDRATVLPDFDRAYKAAGSPRLAVFFNRTLSDEVREWRTDIRGVVAISGDVTASDGEKRSTFKGPGGISAYAQTHVENDTLRAYPADESWKWRFEQGFLDPLIDARARVVDRATIMRLEAAASGRQGSAYNPMAVKKVEMDALLGKADLFVEILVQRDPQSDVGYVFKATAKEVKTGFVLANVTSLDWDYRPVQKKIIATDRGYEITSEPLDAQLPGIDVVADDLSLALMRSLANRWR